MASSDEWTTRLMERPRWSRAGRSTVSGRFGSVARRVARFPPECWIMWWIAGLLVFIKTVYVVIVVPGRPVYWFEVFEVVFIAVLALAVAYAGDRLAAETYDDTARWWVPVGTIEGFALLFIVAELFFLKLLFEGVNISQGMVFQGQLLVGSIGAVSGAFIALNRLQLRRRADVIAEQRNGFAALNHTLRHHILNGITIIDGYVGFIADEPGDRTAGYVRTVRDRCKLVADTVTNIGLIGRVFSDEFERQPVRLNGVIRRAQEGIEETYPGLEITRSIPPDLHVVGHEVLPAVFENLLIELIDTAGLESPTIAFEATVEAGSARVVIEVNRNGPEDVPLGASEGTQFLEESVGFFMAAKVFDRLGGDFWIDATRGDGYTMVVETALAEAA